MFLKSTPAPEERAVIADVPAAARLEDAYRAADQEVARQPKILDLSNVFDGVREKVFFDDVHINEEGNRRIARAIYGQLASRAGARLTQGAGNPDR